MSYEATLTLDFGNGGRNGLKAALANLRSQAPEGLAVRAIFAPAGKA